MHTQIVFQDPVLDTGPYHMMDDLACAPESSGSILVTHRVDQVTSKKTDHTPAATEVGVAADASA